MIDARDFLEAVSGYTNQPEGNTPASKDRPVKLGTVDPFYTAGPARVLFDGEPVMSLKGYAWAAAYTPTAGDRVYLVPVGQSYIIGGKVQSSTPYARYFPLSFANGWVDYDTLNYQNGSFTKTASGVVMLTGVVKSGVASNDALIATLPVGFRPAKKMTFAANSNGVAGTVYVDTNGEVRVKQWVSSIWLSLANIRFPTEILTWNDVTLLNGFGAPVDTTIGTPQYALDSYKRLWFRGGVNRTGALPTVDTTMFNVPVGRPDKQQHLVASSLDGANNFGHLHVNPAGDVPWKVGSTTAHMMLGGVMVSDSSASWTAGTFQGGWVNYDTASFPGASYYKDADGVVYLKGLVRAGAIGSTIFNLPAGYRPSRTIIRINSSNQAMGRVDIQANGNIIPVAGSNGWFSLDGIFFTPEQ